MKAVVVSEGHSSVTFHDGVERAVHFVESLGQHIVVVEDKLADEIEKRFPGHFEMIAEPEVAAEPSEPAKEPEPVKEPEPEKPAESEPVVEPEKPAESVEAEPAVEESHESPEAESHEDAAAA